MDAMASSNGDGSSIGQGPAIQKQSSASTTACAEKSVTKQPPRKGEVGMEVACPSIHGPLTSGASLDVAVQASRGSMTSSERKCGTPYCSLDDWHLGPCREKGPSPGKRERKQAILTNIQDDSPKRSKKPAKLASGLPAAEKMPSLKSFTAKPMSTAEVFSAGEAPTKKISAARPSNGKASAAMISPGQVDRPAPVEKQQSVAKRARAPPRASSAPHAVAVPVQEIGANGLFRFYDPLRWGVPLPIGPVKKEAATDLKVDCKWQLEQTAQRIAGRGVPDDRAMFMQLWNGFVDDGPRMPSDRLLPAACRRFAKQHAQLVKECFMTAFTEHLINLWEINLLHVEDVQDCLLTIESAFVRKAGLCSGCHRPLHAVDCEQHGRLSGAARWPGSTGIGFENNVSMCEPCLP